MASTPRTLRRTLLTAPGPLMNRVSDVPRELPTGPLIDVAPPRQLFAGTAYAIRALWSHRELWGLLIQRELKSRYKDSALGFAWSLFRPLTLLLIYYLAVGQVLGAAKDIPFFALYIFTGLTAWTFFSEYVSVSTSAIVQNSGLVKKVYVPRELFPLASLGSSLFNFGIQFAILLVALVVFGQFPISPNLLYLPLAFVVLVLFSVALGLLLSATNVYLRDVQHLVEVAIMVLFWASPIVYSYDMVHDVLKGNWIEQIYLLNPMTLIIIAFQKALWLAGDTPDRVWPEFLVLRLAIAALLSIVFLWFCQRIFARLEGNFAQEL
jgi:ABC-2 type transport system permease protein